MLPQLWPSPSAASALTIWRRTGSLSAWRTAASSSWVRSGWEMVIVRWSSNICYCTTTIVLAPYVTQETAMNDAPRTPDPGRRRGVVRRATRALVTNYIHELSDRHGGHEGRRA